MKGIADLCAAGHVRSGELRATGWLEEVEIHDYDQRARCLRPRSLGTPVQLLNLTGTIAEQEGALSVSAHVVLSRETDNGNQVIGGLLSSAKVFLVEIVIDAFDDLILRRGLELKTGVVAWLETIEAEPLAQQEPRDIRETQRPAPAGNAAPSPAPSAARVNPPVGPPPDKIDRSDKIDKNAPLRLMDPFGLKNQPSAAAAEPSPSLPSAPGRPAQSAADWEAVKAASEDRDEEYEPEPGAEPPRNGDIVEHTTFGRCTIEKVEMEQDRVSVRVRSGRLVQLSLEYLLLEPIGKQGASRIFKAVKRR